MSRTRIYTLQDYLDYHLAGREPEFSYKPGQPEKYDSWREGLTRRLAETFGKLPAPVDLCPETLMARDLDDIRAEKIVFDSSAGLSVPAWLLIPPGCSADSARPTILLIPGHTGVNSPGPGRIVDRTSGKAHYVGLDPDGNPFDTGVHNDIGQTLARAGFVVLCPDLLAFGERSSDTGWARNHWMHVCDIHADALVWLTDSSLPAIHLCDLQRCLDYLQTRPEADLERLAVVGHSLGATFATYLSVLDSRFKATVASCSYATTEARTRNRKLALCSAQVLPGEAKIVEGTDLLCALVPRPLLMCFGDQDPGMTATQARATGEKVRHAYNELGFGDRCTAHVFAGGHIVDTPTIVQWLKEWL